MLLQTQFVSSDPVWQKRAIFDTPQTQNDMNGTEKQIGKNKIQKPLGNKVLLRKVCWTCGVYTEVTFAV